MLSGLQAVYVCASAAGSVLARSAIVENADDFIMLVVLYSGLNVVVGRSVSRVDQTRSRS